MPPSSRATEEQERAPKRRRTKTFTGCWTCRSRHVKCDERKPTCVRCDKTKVACQGYGVRLSWPDSTRSTLPDVSVGAIESSNVPPPHDAVLAAALQPPRYRPGVPPSEQEGTRHDGEVDGLGAGVGLTAARPAQVHDVTQDDLSASYSPAHLDVGDRGPSASAWRLDFIDANPAFWVPSPVASSTSPRALFPSFDLFPEPSTAARRELVEERENDDLDNGAPRLAAAFSAGSPPGAPSSLAGSARDRELGRLPRTLDVLPDLGLQCQLLEHWTTELGEKLLPVPSLDDPFRTIFTAIALDGARSTHGSYSAATAVFHLICAASAYQLSRKKGSADARQDFKMLCLRHQNLGLLNLRHSICSTNPSQRVSILAALTMCMAHQTLVFGDASWRLHMQGACDWIQQIDPRVWAENSRTSTIYQIFLVFAAIVQLQLLSENENGHEHRRLFITFEHPDHLYCLDRIFGLSRSTWDNLFAVAQMHLCHDEPPAQRARRLDLLEMELYLSVPQEEPPVDAAVGMEERRMIFHQGSAFYCTLLIHLKRALRHVPVRDVQTLVAKSLDHLEAMLATTRRKFCPAVWCVATTALEACTGDLQHRIVTYLDQLEERTQFECWSGIKSVVSEVWQVRRRAHGADEDAPWPEILKRSKFPKFLLL